MSSAKWWTSLASPDSTTRPTWVLVFSRTRWWCTAAVSKSEGIGARLCVELRSERTIRFAPCSIAAETLPHTCPTAASSSAAPCADGTAGSPSGSKKSPSTRTALKPADASVASTIKSFARSSRSITGDGSEICRQLSGRASNRLPSGPIVPAIEVTVSSRIASRGGLVTWAKTWEK